MIVSGPQVVVHDQHIHLFPFHSIPMVSQRSTKAELLAAYQVLQVAQSQGPSWQQIGQKVISTATAVSRETVTLVKDCYNAGTIARQWVSRIVDELSRPVIRSF